MTKWVCAVCGWTVEQENQPEICPLCKATKFNKMDEQAGFILPIDETAWLNALEKCRTLFLEDSYAYENMRKTAHERSLKYTMESSTKAQFEYFRKLKKDAYLKK